MCASHTRLKTPEEIELSRKREELARFQWHLSELEQTLASLKGEIRVFEQKYEKSLGKRIRELEDLEWQVNGFLGEEIVPDQDETESCEEKVVHFHRRTDLLDDDEYASQNPEHKSLKSLYREVAKAIHPDLAPDEEERMRRQELMAFANRAYGEGDRAALEEILSDWELTPEQGQGDEADVAFELVRVIRSIARVQQNIHAVMRQIEELKATDIHIFMRRVEAAEADGGDILAEMAARVEYDIRATKRHLATLRGDDGDEPGSRGVQQPATRLLHFPAEHSCGMVYERNAGSMDYRDWQRLGVARGVREVRLDRAVRLDVKGKKGDGMGFLNQLDPDDLQALFLYEIDDAALDCLAHLTGLHELYLSDTSVSDEGLRRLGKLEGLQRLSIYHTAISDAGLENLTRLSELKWLTCSGTEITEDGLERFRQRVPGCKAVNFQWRYNRK